MRNYVLAILFIALAAALGAAIGPFTELDIGHFAGKLASYASGDTLAMVYYDNPGSDPTTEGWIVFRKSTDGGVTWTSQNVVMTEDCLTKPTLFYSPEEILICYTHNTLRMISRSTDGGLTWQNETTEYVEYYHHSSGRTFENSSYVERRDGELKLFALDIPYPEYDQERYSHPDHPEELLAPMSYADRLETPNMTIAFFQGPDTFDGLVRGNTDLFIKRTSGGANDGWPVFTEPVIAGGYVASYSGACPENDVFQEGLIEYAPELVMDSTLTTGNIQVVGPEDYYPENIIFVDVQGDYYTGYYGYVLDPYREYADVYNPYPFPDEDNFQFRNQYMIRDTIWINVTSGTCNDSVQLVKGKLWIRGNFGSHQTWIAQDTIYIVGDITLEGTTPGQSPDLNTIDMVNLISQKSILLKYGYKDPVDSLRYHPLCRADDEPINIYANLYAFGDGLGNSHADGVFTFEYQHPHPSVPAVWHNRTLYDNIDLHRYRFPQTSANQWAYANGIRNLQIDYPWYNPLWPERTPYLERGTISLWGSVNQRRSGYMHRPYLDTEYPNNGVWNQELDFCGGSSSPAAVNHTDPVLGIELANINYPGATGSGVGYKRNYHNDTRHYLDDCSYGPPEDRRGIWKLGLNLCTMVNDGEFDSFESYHLKHQLRRTHSKAFARKGDNALYSVNDLLLFAEGDVVTDWSASTVENGIIRSLALDESGSALVLQEYSVDGHPIMRISSLSAGTGDVEFSFGMPVDTSMFDAAILPNGRRIIAWFDAETGLVYVNELYPGPVTVFLETWDLNNADPELYDLAASRMYLVPASDNSLDVFLWLRELGTDPNLPGTLFHARAQVNVANDDAALPPLPQMNLTAYPNPAFGQMTIKLSSGAPLQDVRLGVYNLRGQLVRSLDLSAVQDGDYECQWNGLDSSGKAAGRGIYFLRLLLDNKVVRNKRICWM